MTRLIVILFLTLVSGVTHAGDDMPSWVITGIISVETNSTFDRDGNVQYVNRTRGAAGERGVCQVQLSAFNMVKLSGERFSDCDDPAFCVEIAVRYLHYLKNRYGSWVNAVQAYNAGRPGTKAGRRYLNKVYRVMGML